MKKLLCLSLLILATVTSAFSSGKIISPEKVSYRARVHFANEFGSVGNATWTQEKYYTKATFLNNNERKEAYYALGGEFIGTGTAVSIQKIPLDVKRAIAKKYGDYNIKETMEFNGVDESAWYISAENEKRSVILKVSAEGFVYLMEKTQKVP